MALERGEEGEEDGEAHFKDLRDAGHSVLGERHAEELLDGRDEDVVGTEDGTRVLENGE